MDITFVFDDEMAFDVKGMRHAVNAATAPYCPAPTIDIKSIPTALLGLMSSAVAGPLRFEASTSLIG